jgi:hypothetical protein
LFYPNVFHVFLQVFQMHVSSVSDAFIRMLQMLHLDVLKIDWVLHLYPCFLLPLLGVSSPGAGWHPPHPPPLLYFGDVRGARETA